MSKVYEKAFPSLEGLVQEYAHEELKVFNMKTGKFTVKGRKHFNDMTTFIYRVFRLTDINPEIADRIVDRLEEIYNFC